jgi:hypothetical protein
MNTYTPNIPTPDEQMHFFAAWVSVLEREMSMPGRVLTKDEEAAVVLLVAITLASESHALRELYDVVRPWAAGRTRKLIEAVQGSNMEVNN